MQQAAARIQEVLQKERSKYFIRADIESFYKSILHHKLFEDVKQHYDDPKLVAALKEIIINPIDTPFGTINPDSGIALRGPFSQFFSGLYLKPLDDAFNSMEATHVRFQDAVLIPCNTQRQLNRCRRKMNAVLQERHLLLSRKKSRLGCIETTEFHFLGISYPPTRPRDNTNTVQANNRMITGFWSKRMSLFGLSLAASRIFLTSTGLFHKTRLASMEESLSASSSGLNALKSVLHVELSLKAVSSGK